MARLDRSLGELRAPMSPALSVVLRETVRRNRVRNGIVYVQVTVAWRHAIFHFHPPIYSRLWS
jgi:D-alanine transaminase